jgi:3-dehydroquinate dehydratase-1
VPFIVTVRHPKEGGMNRLGPEARRALYAQFLEHAALIDVELRSVESLGGVLAAARERGVKLIVSAHDFRATPSEARLCQIIRRSVAVGADICKIAARADHPKAVQSLLSLLARRAPAPLSVMAMGRFGKVSRLLFARAGSVLNYGYLAAPNASGQWPAVQLKERLAELDE